MSDEERKLRDRRERLMQVIATARDEVGYIDAALGAIRTRRIADIADRYRAREARKSAAKNPTAFNERAEERRDGVA